MRLGLRKPNAVVSSFGKIRHKEGQPARYSIREGMVAGEPSEPLPAFILRVGRISTTTAWISLALEALAVQYGVVHARNHLPNCSPGRGDRCHSTTASP